MQSIEESIVDDVTQLLHKTYKLTHLRARKRGAILTVESGPADDAIPHFRLRRLARSLWGLEFPARGTKWEGTPYSDELEALIELIVTKFSWTVQAY